MFNNNICYYIILIHKMFPTKSCTHVHVPSFSRDSISMSSVNPLPLATCLSNTTLHWACALHEKMVNTSNMASCYEETCKSANIHSWVSRFKHMISILQTNFNRYIYQIISSNVVPSTPIKSMLPACRNSHKSIVYFYNYTLLKTTDSTDQYLHVVTWSSTRYCRLLMNKLSALPVALNMRSPQDKATAWSVSTGHNRFVITSICMISSILGYNYSVWICFYLRRQHSTLT